VRTLEGHPRAMLLAAALWATDGPAYARSHVQAHPAAGLAHRFDFAYDPLGGELRAWLVRAAAFAGGIQAKTLALAAAEGVGNVQETLPTEEDVAQADEALRELARRAWLSREGGGRCRVHPVVRDYVRGKAEPDALRAAEAGFARTFLSLADTFRAGLGDLEQAGEAVAFAAAERANFLRGQEVLVEQGDREGAVDYAYWLNELFQRTGDWADRRLALARGIEAAKEGEARRDVAGLSHNLGVLAQAQGDYGEARRLYAESLEIAEALGEQAGVAKSLHQLGMLAQGQGDYGEARRLYAESLEIVEAFGDRAGVAITWHQLGVLAQGQGDYGEARRLYAESLKIAEALGDRAGVAISKHALALLEEREGNLPEALALIREAEAIYMALGSPDAGQARQVRQRIEKAAGG